MTNELNGKLVPMNVASVVVDVYQSQDGKLMYSIKTPQGAQLSLSLNETDFECDLSRVIDVAVEEISKIKEND